MQLASLRGTNLKSRRLRCVDRPPCRNHSLTFTLNDLARDTSHAICIMISTRYLGRAIIKTSPPPSGASTVLSITNKKRSSHSSRPRSKLAA
jgi:hypothetical protein